MCLRKSTLVSSATQNVRLFLKLAYLLLGVVYHEERLQIYNNGSGCKEKKSYGDFRNFKESEYFSKTETKSVSWARNRFKSKFVYCFFL